MEQFAIVPIQPISFFGLFDISYTNCANSILICIILGLSFFQLGLHKATLIPSLYQSCIELLYSFIITIIKQQAGLKAIKYFPLIFTMFVFILISNLVGLVPNNFTSTSHGIVTLTLSLSMNIGFFLLGCATFGFYYIWFFIPTQGPILLIPILVVIELISYCLRPFSLAIRLFANMMAGHTLLYILSSFVIGLSKSSYFIISILPFFLVVAVVFLEVGIAFLQAYVFAILLAIYLNDSLNMSH